MVRPPVLFGLVLLLATSAVAPAAGATATDAPRIVGVYANPVTDGDAGEYLLVEAPPDTAGFAITDGETTLSLPPANGTRVRYTDEPVVVRERSVPPPTGGADRSRRVQTVRLEGSLTLSNGGETVRLLRDGEPIQTLTYESAPAGKRYERTEGGWTWQSPGATDFPIWSTGTSGVTAFAVPDAPDAPLAALESATRRIWLAGYTFTSRAVAERLLRANRRGLSVRVLLEGAPVGGIGPRQRRLLDRLVRAGIDVRVIGGPLARYRYHHPKYAIVDDRAIVTSENWKPAGVGGNSSRGWGVIVEPPREGPGVATALSRVFTADRGWRDAIPWRKHRKTLPPPSSGAPAANASYPTHHPATTVSARRVDVLLAPDNTRAGVLGLIRSANHSIAVQQPTLGSPDGPFVAAVLAAADRGVTVRILLDRSWYVREDNRALVEELNRRAQARSLPLEAKLVEPRGRFEKIHAKGVVVDERRVLVGSLNWNHNAITANREVSLVVYSEAVGQYFTRVFDADWDGAERLPIGFGTVAGGALLAVIIGLAWGLSFERSASQ